MATVNRTSQVFTISMPPEMARAAKLLAKRENRTMSELFREAFREYLAKRYDALYESAIPTASPNHYTEEDIARLVRNVRTEMRAEIETESALAAK